MHWEYRTTEWSTSAHVKNLAASCGLIVALSMLAGCNDSLADVAGVVTLDGTPVEGSPDLYGTVIFYREDGGWHPAVGIIQEAGRYEIATGTKRGLEPGNYRVGVAVKKILPPTTPEITQPQHQPSQIWTTGRVGLHGGQARR